MTAWAWAAKSQPAPALFEAIAKASVAQLPQFGEMHVGLLGWAFAAADYPSDLLFDGRAGFVQQCELVASGPMCLNQLHQWQLYRDARATAGLSAWPPLSEALRERCSANFFDLEGTPSLTQRAVRDVLVDVGAEEVREEVRTEQGWTLDLVLEWKGYTVAIEVDGPHHFLHGTRTLTGATAYKRRSLRDFGTKLLPIPYFEWGALEEKERGPYLSKRLDDLILSAAWLDRCVQELTSHEPRAQGGLLEEEAEEEGEEAEAEGLLEEAEVEAEAEEQAVAAASREPTDPRALRRISRRRRRAEGRNKASN